MKKVQDYIERLKNNGKKFDEVALITTEWYGVSIHTPNHHGIYNYACGSQYKGDWRDGKRHGKGKLTLVTGDIFEGDFVASRREGHGVHIYSQPIKNMTYRGEWVKDLRQGYGAVEWPDGTFFQGKWQEGRQIFGTFVWPFKGEYTGDWKGSDMEGEGTFKSRDGDTYQGIWKSSAMNGEGERRSVNGDLYRGIWKDGQLNGIGIIRTQYGSYEGDLVNSIENGKGAMTWRDGSIYAGDWLDGIPHGHGKFLSKTGENYEGDFIHGKKQGKGRKVFVNGDIYEGEWYDDLMCGHGIMVYAYSELEKNKVPSKYVGSWKNNIREGFGTMRYDDGSLYEGEWKHGKRNGQGRLSMRFEDYGDNDRLHYTGQFFNDLMHGYGEMIWPGGSTYKGEWVRGVQEGRGRLDSDKKQDKEQDTGGFYFNNQLVMGDLHLIKEKNLRRVQDFHKAVERDVYIEPEPYYEEEDDEEQQQQYQDEDEYQDQGQNQDQDQYQDQQQTHEQ